MGKLKRIKKIRDNLVAEEIMAIKQKLTHVQRILSKGKLEEARDELEEIVFALNHIIQQVNNQEAEREVSFAVWHLDRAIRLIFHEIIGD